MQIVQARTPVDFEAARILFEEYAASLGSALCLQRFAAELETLPVMYGPPRGCLLLACTGGQSAGCVALRAKTDTSGEMKRLYVRPGARGLGLGRRLAEAVVDEARRLGYARVVLDTLYSMDRARALYQALGFRETEPPRPTSDVIYMELDLAPESPPPALHSLLGHEPRG